MIQLEHGKQNSPDFTSLQHPFSFRHLFLLPRLWLAFWKRKYGSDIRICRSAGNFVFAGYIIPKKTANPLRFEKDIFFGLMVGLLWTLEIGLNNLIMPPLPARDFYDNVFWAVIAAAILVYAGYRSFQTNLKDGVLAGFSSGLGSGAVACATALLFIVFGMRQLLSDPLNIIEWSKRGAASNTPDMSVYFAYQTLAGAILHLLILVLIMGLFLGIVGGIIGKSLRYLVKSFK